MSVFEQLQPFVSLCQACGMIPFTIERNSITGKFERFAFSFKHFATWWFLFILVLQVSVIIVVGNLSREVQDVLMADRNIPTTLIVLSGITSSAFIAQLLSSRWIPLNYRHLRNAIEALQKVEQLFGDKFIEEHKSSAMIRFIVGFVIVLITATGAIFIMAPMYAGLLPSNLSIFSITGLFTVLASINVIFDSGLLFVHLSYYIIAHYIQLISLRCNDEDNHDFQTTGHKRTENIQIMRRNALIFDYLCRVSSEINSIFSLPALFLLVVKFITVISIAYAFVYGLIHANTMLDNAFWLYPFFFLTESIRILFFLLAADMPVNQVHLLHEHFTALSLSGFSKTLAEKMTMMTLLVQIDVERIQLSAAGLFKVGVHLIPAITGAAVTYMVILLQN